MARLGDCLRRHLRARECGGSRGVAASVADRGECAGTAGGGPVSHRRPATQRMLCWDWDRAGDLFRRRRDVHRLRAQRGNAVSSAEEADQSEVTNWMAGAKLLLAQHPTVYGRECNMQRLVFLFALTLASGACLAQVRPAFTLSAGYSDIHISRSAGDLHYDHDGGYVDGELSLNFGRRPVGLMLGVGVSASYHYDTEDFHNRDFNFNDNNSYLGFYSIEGRI